MSGHMGTFIRRSMQLITKTLRLQPEKVLAGKDFDGNNYYEVLPQRYFFGLAQVEKAKRIVVPPSGIQAAAMDYKVTNEWTAWLQHKRELPPTPGEIHGNILKKESVSQKVEALNIKEKTRQPKVIENLTKEDESQTVESWTDERK